MRYVSVNGAVWDRVENEYVSPEKVVGRSKKTPRGFVDGLPVVGFRRAVREELIPAKYSYYWVVPQDEYSCGCEYCCGRNVLKVDLPKPSAELKLT